MASVTYGSIRSVTYSRVGQSEAPATFTSRIPAKNSRTQRLPTFQTHEIEVGKFLGSGSFSTVYSVRVRSQQDLDFSYTSILDTHSVSTVPTDGSWGEDEESLDDNRSVATYSVFRVKSGLGQSSRTLKINATDRHKHAIKRMREDLVAKKRREAIEVLRNEVSVLSLLPSFHPNIINIHGISDNFWADTRNGFFVIERLVESLDTTLKRWKAEALQGGNNKKQSRSRWSFFRRRSSNNHNRHRNSKKKQLHLSRQSQAERVNSVGVDLAKALFFLHKNWILFRDLKSENIGFDLDGNVRIFDFGLARRFKPGIHRKITMHVGTLRYMAPEVARSEPYGYPADVYSFALVLWELCTFDMPYAHCKTYDQLKDVVRRRGTHPSVEVIESPVLQSLLRDCWHWNPAARPSMNAVFAGLIKEVGATVTEKKEHIAI